MDKARIPAPACSCSVTASVSYRVEKKAAMRIALADMEAEIESVPTDATGRKPGSDAGGRVLS